MTATIDVAERYVEQVMKALDTAFDPDPINSTSWKKLLRPYVDRNMREAFVEVRRQERRATVERIIKRLTDYYYLADSSPDTHPGVFAILDEEAAR